MPSRKPSASAAVATTGPVKSLAHFIKDKKRAHCPVCALPVEIREQLGTAATKRGFTRQEQVEWLRVSVGAKDITSEVLAQHFSGKHEEATS